MKHGSNVHDPNAAIPIAVVVAVVNKVAGEIAGVMIAVAAADANAGVVIAAIDHAAKAVENHAANKAAEIKDEVETIVLPAAARWSRPKRKQELNAKRSRAAQKRAVQNHVAQNLAAKNHVVVVVIAADVIAAIVRAANATRAGRKVNATNHARPFPKHRGRPNHGAIAMTKTTIWMICVHPFAR